MFNLNEELRRNYGLHRSGWAYAVNSLSSLHSDSGPELVSFIEKKFIFGSEKGDRMNSFQNVLKPWVGFLHVPVNVPVWFNRHFSPVELFQNEQFQESLRYCKGIYTLSAPLSDWVSNNYDGPVNTLLHPTEMVEHIFDRKKFLAVDKVKVVQLGFWLRKLHAIHQLNLDSRKFEKIVVGTSQPYQQSIVHLERQIFDFDFDDSNVVYKGFMDNVEYDNLLSESIVFVDFYDTSANNAIIEAMARATPIICPPNRAIIDYLGEDYPLYFNSYQEVEDMLADKELIVLAHDYLVNSGVREKLTASHFRNELSNTKSDFL